MSAYEKLTMSASKRLFVSMLLLSLTCLSALADDYTMHVGDNLELSVLGVPELKQRAPIELSGTVNISPIGDIAAAGLTLASVRSAIEQKLTAQSFRRQTPNGTETYSIARTDISVQIVQYRPVYVSGDVAKPGEIAYQPQLTVRQAIAVAGGIGQERGSTNQFDLQKQYAEAKITLAKETARIWRIRTELGETNDPAPLVPDVDEGALASILTGEKSLLKTQQDSLSSQKMFLQSALQQSKNRIAALESQAKNEQQGASLDAADVDRVAEAFRQGNISIARLTEVRRAALLASSRALQTSVALEDAKRERDELNSKVERLAIDHKVELMKQNEDAIPRWKAAEAAMSNLVRQLARAGGSVDVTPRIVIFRKTAGEQKAIEADENADLLPGDTVALSLVKRSGNGSREALAR